MRIDDRQIPDTSDELDVPFPEDAAAYVWAADSEFRCGNPGDYVDELPDELDLSRIEVNDRERFPAIEFEPGDELPPSLARDIWLSFHDRIAVFDEDQQRVDTVSSRNESQRALERWHERQVDRNEAGLETQEPEDPSDSEEAPAD